MTSNQNLIPKYESGEKLLCFHGPLLYEAKCLDVKVKEDGVVYFVHYQGWNKNWDEWVTDKRIFKYNDEGLKKQKELERQIKSGKKVKILRKSDLKNQAYPPPEIFNEVERTLKPVEVKQEEKSEENVKQVNTVASKSKAVKEPRDDTKSTPSPAANAPVKQSEHTRQTNEESVVSCNQPPPPTVTARRRKGRHGTNEGPVDNDEGFLTKLQLTVELPDSLKAWLVDDWDLITRQARLYELPASCPISSLMSDFLQPSAVAATNEPKREASNLNVSITADLRHEFIAGLQHYFNLVVGSQLLYKFERLQYAELLKHHTEKKMSDVYGPIHLLRLIVKLREMVSCTKVDPNSLPVIEVLVAELLLFMHNNRKDYFRLEDYTVATAEYQRRAMC